MTRIDGELEKNSVGKKEQYFWTLSPKPCGLWRVLVWVSGLGGVSPGALQCFGGCQAQTSVVSGKERAGATAARNNPVCARWLLSDRNNPLLWSF